MMTGLTPAVEIGAVAEERLAVDVEQGPLLAAALAAALVEYRRYVRQQNKHAGPDSSRTNWRIVSRLEQLRSQT
jgi:hypothetical protein